MFEYSGTYLGADNKKFSGICFGIPDFSIYKNDYVEYIISGAMAYKVNELAYLLYRAENLSWVLDEINHAYDISFYSQGTTIKYLPEKYLINMGIL